MDLALINLQRLICHKTQTTNQLAEMNVMSNKNLYKKLYQYKYLIINIPRTLFHLLTRL